MFFVLFFFIAGIGLLGIVHTVPDDLRGHRCLKERKLWLPERAEAAKTASRT